MRVTFYTLGCKVNQNETGALAQLFEENGYTVVSNEEGADVYIVNSCTVTNFGDQKSRKWLRRAKRENPGAVTVLTGCYPQAFPDEAAEIAEADVVTGSGNRHAILTDVQKVLNGEEERVVDIRPHEKGERFEELPMDKFAEHTRAFVKVEDGCNRRCAYCVIPRARGPVRSRDEASVLEELCRLAGAGYKEVVLTAISLPSYGTDSGTSLVELIEKAAEVPGIERIRLGSLDPDMLHDDDIRRMAAVKKLCPQFHLSLQSGCDKTLRAMRRPYTTAQYADIATKLRAAFGADNVSFTTDVIVGFPGETEDDFEASMAFVTGMRFLKVHVFPYSRREGTAAYDFADQLPEHEKEARSRRMTAAVEEVRAAEAAAMQGRKASVLLETPLSATMFTGYTKQYLPVLVSAPGHKTGDIVEVTLGAWDGKRCRAEIV
ncbi:MAG: tRNA (N(6)-L-threonylcarbamoyladenosine(37)-C(2))-methylthiotransferase MtaB [Gemmiger formicilis]|uniref:tRNA (N(6)-L-threonylcarbamoyladenosine(37)-C(2))- methylthiotransferase MtaB n=1 Tax=Gemmiger formicilis TaxID=745368 RepID=UPI002EA88228|nr:tRNA (N(6)-L-threonylcarbamoyladenosine(37)-C(2))-methylthiotransferase MtaB [Gemmiger formicilis]